MSTPQPGIFALGTSSHYHLELDRRSDVTTEEVAAAVRALRAPSVTSGGSNLVVGFGADLWREIAPGEAPAALVPFTAIEGAGRRAPATQHDVWVWVHGTGPDVLLDNARAVVGAPRRLRRSHPSSTSPASSTAPRTPPCTTAPRSRPSRRGSREREARSRSPCSGSMTSMPSGHSPSPIRSR